VRGKDEVESAVEKAKFEGDELLNKCERRVGKLRVEGAKFKK